MTYTLHPFKRWHMAVLVAHEKPAGGFYLPGGDMLSVLEAAPNVATIFADDLPIASGGTVQLWPGRHMAWACLPSTSGPHMAHVTRQAYNRVRAVPGRVEMAVRKDFELGHRWADMLGFSVETPCLRGYDPVDGTDHVGYVLINARGD